MLVNRTECNILPKKGLNVAHININSLRNKLSEIENLLSEKNVYILALTETHLDQTFEDGELFIQGYNVYRKDRNKYGGGVAFYIRDHLPVKIRTDVMISDIEALWLQIQMPHTKPLLMACCYRPPSADGAYLDKICDMFDRSSTSGYEVYFMGDMNIDWLSGKCPLKNKLVNVANICGLTQVINKPTRTLLKTDGKGSSTCIDHVFTNVPELCSAILCIPVGYSDHKLIMINRKVKMIKAGPKIIHKRSYRFFRKEEFIDVQNSSWLNVLSKTDPEALYEFNNIFMRLVDQHAPLKKFVVRATSTPWLDKELKDSMKERDNANITANITGNQLDWKVYRKLRNHVTKLNREKKNYTMKNK